MSTPGKQATTCTCDPAKRCDGERYVPDDPRTCIHCRDIDGEMPCPANPVPSEATVEWLANLLCESVEWLANLLCKSVESGEAVFERTVVRADGSEPFASGHGLYLDLTAKVRRGS